MIPISLHEGLNGKTTRDAEDKIEGDSKWLALIQKFSSYLLKLDEIGQVGKYCPCK
jgi:hypothetical protein